MARSRWATLCVVFMVGLLALTAFAGPALAQEEEADAGGGKSGQSLFDMFMAGGTIGMFIVALNVIALALAIEYFASMRRDKLIPPEILGELEVLFEDEEYEEALELCEAEPSYFTNVVASGLPRMNSGYDTMMETMAGTADSETFRLNAKVGYLTLICAVAPMLGLLGTVQGMIMAFNKIAASKGAPEPAELASSIGLALVTTFEGLCVAIPFLTVVYVLKVKVTKLAGEVSGAVEDLFERFRPVKK
jgi:biopolymer transport protein ExbB